MAISNEEYALFYERACAIYDALKDGLPKDDPEADNLMDVGEVSGALYTLARDYEKLSIKPPVSTVSELKSLNEKYPFVSMVAVEDRLKAIS